MEINPDYLLNWPLGTVELVVNLRDIDGITGLSQTLSFELQGSEPILDFSSMPTEFISGNSSTLLVEIVDLDGIEGMECSILLKDDDDITLFSQIYRPDAGGLWTQEWTPPGQLEANHTLYFACLDETSLSVSESFDVRAREATIVPVAEENNFKPIFSEVEFCGDNAAMIAWAGIQRYKKRLLNDLNVEPKSRWPLDKEAPYMKGPGLKL